MNPRYILDANVVLRFLRNDDPVQSPAAQRLFARASEAKATLFLSSVTVAEIFYVLARAYKMRKPAVGAVLIPFIQSEVIEVECRARVLNTLKRVVEANVDFGDAYLAAVAVERAETVASFDRDLRVFSDIVTETP